MIQHDALVGDLMHPIRRRLGRLAFGRLALGSLGFGSLGFGSLAFGRLALGRLAFGRLAFGRLAFGRLAFGRLAARACALALVVGVVATFGTGCTPVAPYERGKLAHPTMTAADLAGMGEQHLRAIDEGATGGSAGTGSGCGCN